MSIVANAWYTPDDICATLDPKSVKTGVNLGVANVPSCNSPYYSIIIINIVNLLLT